MQCHSAIFRSEALDSHSRGFVAHDDVLHISSAWTKWSYWLLIALFMDRERVSLSLKATQEDPWKEFERTSQAGSVITGTVTKLVPFGAFVRVAQGIEGLVHISEISHGKS